MALKKYFDRKGMFVFPWYISDLTVTKDIKKIMGAKIDDVFVQIEDSTLTLWIETDSLNRTGELLLKKIIKDKTFFKKVIKNIYLESKDLIKYCRNNTNKDLNKISNQGLIKIYSSYIKKLRQLRTWGWVPVLLEGFDKSYLTDYLQNALSQFLIKIKFNGDSNKFYSILSSSEKMSEVQNEELARLDILLNKNKALYDKQIEKHLKKFGWLTYSYSGPVMQREYLLNVLKDNQDRGNISTQKINIINHYKNIKKEKCEIIKKLKLPKNLIHLFKVSAELMYIKDYRKGVYQQSYVMMDLVLEEIAKRLGLNLKEIKFFVTEEIKDALFGKMTRGEINKIAKSRTKLCCYRVRDGEISVFQDDKCLKMIQKINKTPSTDNSKTELAREIKGTIAYNGFAKGTVKIVLTATDISKMNEGDILVSSSTNPDLILAMKKAAAFVTDTGGIISHAAIVSREMKKPCIVGTKIATHLLKDGDLVEVDANNGIVKII